MTHQDVHSPDGEPCHPLPGEAPAVWPAAK